MSRTSELSKVYSQYQYSLEIAHDEYNARLKEFAEFLRKRYDELIKDHVCSFKSIFESQIERLEIKRHAENFFGTSEITFVAIDGSCLKHAGANFVSFYGGAYGSKGVVSLEGPSGSIRYSRWELNKDVSMVAFIPVPPEMMSSTMDDEVTTSTESPQVLSDYEISEISSLHTKVMQLAEIYLAYSLARSSAVDTPKIIMVDSTLCGILANSSFSPKSSRLQNGDFDGEFLTEADMHIALAHPINKELDIPSTKLFQPHYRVIAEAVWKESPQIDWKDCKDFPLDHFRSGARYLDETVGAGTFYESENSFTFKEDPRSSWRKTIGMFEQICERIFREKDPKGVTYKVRDENRREYFLPKDFQFLIGVGIRALMELCWRRRILLVGIVKDSFSRYFYRNYLGTVSLLQGDNVPRHLRLPLTDRTIVEILPNIVEEIEAPWSTVEYDSCFMTLHAEQSGSSEWEVKGYNHPSLGETTRPERIFLRSLAQFFMTEDKNLASHALFMDRLIYPGWDDMDSKELALKTKHFGEIRPFNFDCVDRPSRLHTLTMYLMSVLVRNHFPEALGYPDPLHQADWGARSLRRRVTGLLDSSEWAYRANPRERTFREIRESFRR